MNEWNEPEMKERTEVLEFSDEQPERTGPTKEVLVDIEVSIEGLDPKSQDYSEYKKSRHLKITSWEDFSTIILYLREALELSGVFEP
jgi:hypothetical protein